MIFARRKRKSKPPHPPGTPPPCYEDYFSGGTTATLCSPDIESLTIHLSSTADLTAVSGADIWEKIKNAPAWTSEYEQVKCSCGGGCTDDYTYYLCGCTKLSTCFCIEADCDVTESGASPIDQQCLYAVGEIDMTFADE